MSVSRGCQNDEKWGHTAEAATEVLVDGEIEDAFDPKCDVRYVDRIFWRMGA